MNPLPVLFVDDDRSNLLLFRVGFEPVPVLLAANADEALEILQRQPVAALVTDQRMPGLSGTALAALVKERFPKLPRLLLTAHPDAPEVKAAQASGLVARVLGKPWKLETLKTALEEVLRTTEAPPGEGG